MSFSTYIFIGSIYGLVNLLYNMFIANDNYAACELSFTMELVAYILDLFLWPLWIVVDVLNKLKRASK